MELTRIKLFRPDQSLFIGGKVVISIERSNHFILAAVARRLTPAPLSVSFGLSSPRAGAISLCRPHSPLIVRRGYLNIVLIACQNDRPSRC